jgi:hypothetical protein
MRLARVAIGFAASVALAQACSSHSTHDSEAPDSGASAAGVAGQGNGIGGAGGTSAGAAPNQAAAGVTGEGGEAGGEVVDAGPHPAFTWQVSYGQSYAAHVAVDSTGAAIVSGSFFDSSDITLGNTTLKSHGSADVMLSRVLADATVDWARSYGGTAEDYPVSFVLDAQDRIALTGLYNGTGNLGGADFPPFAGNAGRYDASIASFEKNGDPRWSQTITSNAEAFAGPGLAVDATGHLFVPGSFLGTASIGGIEHVSLGSWDAFLARYDEPNGVLGTATPFGGTAEDRADIVLLTGSDCILIGRFSGSVTFPTTPTPTTLISAGGFDVFIARASQAGVLNSVVAFGGANDEQVEGARLDSLGRLVLAGNFSSPTLSIFGGNPLHSAGGEDIFLARLSPTLEEQWSVSFGSDADDAVRDLSIGPNDTLAITGEFRDHLQLGDRGWDATPSADAGASQIDFFVATLDSNGQPIWSYAAGGPGQERGLSVAADSIGGLYVVASTTSSIDFGNGTPLTAASGQFASALVRYVP